MFHVPEHSVDHQVCYNVYVDRIDRSVQKCPYHKEKTLDIK